MKEIWMTQIPIHGRGHKNWFIQPLEYHTAVKKDGGRLIQNSQRHIDKKNMVKKQCVYVSLFGIKKLMKPFSLLQFVLL